MRFEFFTPTRIIFGPGTVREIGSLAAGFGRHTLVVSGASEERVAPLLASLAGDEIRATVFQVEGEPTTDLVQEGLRVARAGQCDFVVGFGGGSAVDTAKAISALLTNKGDLLDYLEVIGKGQTIARSAAPCIAVPTTAGTGAEVTRNAVLASPAHRVKVSLRSPLMLPRIALVDPELTHSVPPAVTASTGLDALTQVIEPYVSSRANPVTDALCREAMARAARSLRRAYEDGNDSAAREDMAVVSLFGGIALANAGLGAVHGFAGVLGGMYRAPHGAICARLLPRVIKANVRALQERDPQNPALTRYEQVAQILTSHPDATPGDAIRWSTDLCTALQIPPLAAYGLNQHDLPEVVEKSRIASSMKANPIVLTPGELREVLEQAM